MRLNASSWRVSVAARCAARLISVTSNRRGRASHSREQQLGVADDRRQEVVEVVGDPAGELPDRLHLLRLPKLVLQALPLGDVAQVRQKVEAATPASCTMEQLR